MKERLARLKLVRHLIKTRRIESQEVLLELLQKEGYPVTQATLSRDLKSLKVGKIPDGGGGYIYSLPGDGEWREMTHAYIQDFLRGYISIESSGNIVVIKTCSGHSDSVALALDNLGLDDVLGTIAGRDNTVFAVLREGITGQDFMNRMKKDILEMEDKVQSDELS
ncbi:MAG: ArgR family transcriptional regulator [Treponema sp.]|jgi:transcriptional regulator of arginine metabolism|nr:ArgR family transcriptional regulator [Treponema sp.]